MQYSKKFQQKIIDFFHYIRINSDVINEVQIIKEIKKSKKIKKEPKPKIVKENQIDNNIQETFHFLCIKCDMLFTNIQAIKIHQEIHHFECNTYIQKHLKRLQLNKKEQSLQIKKQNILDESKQNGPDMENFSSISESEGEMSSEYYNDQSGEDS